MTNAERESWWGWVEKRLDDRGWSTGDLSRQAGIERSRFTAWRQGNQPSLDNARAVANAFGRPVGEVLVAAGLLLPEEIEVQHAPPRPEDLTDDELLAEVGRRMRSEAAGKSPTAEVREANPRLEVVVDPRKKDHREPGSRRRPS